MNNTEQANAVIYIGPNCVRCDQTMRILDQSGVEYQTINVHENESAMEHMKSLGYSSLPVVFAPEDSDIGHWSGFDIMKIRELTAKLQTPVTI